MAIYRFLVFLLQGAKQEMFFGLELQKQTRKALEGNGQSKKNFILSWNKKSTTGHLESCEEKQVPEFFC